MDSLLQILYVYPHIGVLLALLATGLGLPIPEDIILITAGVMAEQTDSLWLMIIISMVGVLAGDLTVFAIGYLYGERVLGLPPFRWLVTPARLRRVRGYYRKYGYWAIFISRFLAGLRASSYLLAGLSHVPVGLFLLADGTAALLSVPLLVYLGYYFSEDIQAATALLKQVKTNMVLAVLALVALYLLVRFIKKRVFKHVDPPEDDLPLEDPTDRPEPPASPPTTAA